MANLIGHGDDYSSPQFLAATRNWGAFFIWSVLSAIYITDSFTGSQANPKNYIKLYHFYPIFLYGSPILFSGSNQ